MVRYGRPQRHLEQPIFTVELYGVLVLTLLNTQHTHVITWTVSGLDYRCYYQASVQSGLYMCYYQASVQSGLY